MKSSFPAFRPAPAAGGYHESGFWVWCGSAVEEPGKGYHLYASRWRKDYPMLFGYMLFSEIVHAFSPSLEGPYRFVEKVLPSHSRQAWDGCMAHNPAVVRYRDEYLMYYIGSTYEGVPPPPAELAGDPSLAYRSYAAVSIGLARSKTAEGPWTPLDFPILTKRPGMFDGAIVTNPAPCVLPDGRIYLYYRTNTPEGLRIGLAVAERPEGPYERGDAPVMEGIAVEDPFVWHNGSFFEMLAKDITGDLTGQKHAGAHFSSEDGRSWRCLGEAYSRNVVFDNGEKILLGALERPQIFFGADGKKKALFAAAANGPGGFDLASATWNQVIPLEDEYKENL